MYDVDRPVGAGDDDFHIRRLIDARALATRVHNAHFPGPSLSEFSLPDTPSIYSHAYFSPRSVDRQDANAALSDRDRLNDPAASSLDLADDPQASIYSPDDDPEADPESDHEQSMLRMSMLGPKMRVHSLAPWEIDEDPLVEEDESDSGHSKPASIFSRGRNAAGKRHFPVPRASSTSRRSGESTRHQKPKKSLDPAGSGVLHVLAQASQSTSSLTSFSLAASAGRSKLSVAVPHSRAPSTYGPTSPASLRSSNSSAPRSPQNSFHPPSPPPHSIASFRLSNYSADFLPSARPSTTESEADDAFMHPYANPNLVVSYEDSHPRHLSSHHNSASAVARSDSAATITTSAETASTARFAPMVTPDTTIISARYDPLPRLRSPGVSGRGISSPMSVNSPKLRPVDAGARYRETSPIPLRPPSSAVANLPGWQDNVPSPNVTLISLEEAQAQARERSRSSTAHGAVRVPFPEASTPGALRSSPSEMSLHRARARSISAGARAKQALSSIVSASHTGAPRPERRESEGSLAPSALTPLTVGNGVSPRGMKHKRSGLMRLFNAREKEKERNGAYPPPVPPLLDGFVQQAHKVSKSGSNSPPIVVEMSVSQETFLSENQSSNSLGSDLSDRLPNTPLKRLLPPPLSILTHSSAKSSTHSAPPPLPPLPDRSAKQPPHSAPPGKRDFLGLSLRPVSTVFSAHFAEHLVPDVELPDMVPGSSPHSASGCDSPLTPGFPRDSDPGAGGMLRPPSVAVQGAAGDDASAVVQALQDQIVSARKTWQRQVWELEGQVRDLRKEIEDMRGAGGFCKVCGRGNPPMADATEGKAGVVDRPRARTGASGRFGSGT